MSEEESHLGQQDPFSGIRNWLKNISSPSKPQNEDPNAISRREFLQQGAAAATGAAITATLAGKVIENMASQKEDKFVPNYDRFEPVVPNLEVRNFSSVGVALSKSEIANFLAKYGQLQNKVSILFYDAKVPDQLPDGQVLKLNLYEALMPGNVGHLEAFQRKVSGQVAAQLFEIASTGKPEENPIAEKDFEQKIQKGLLPPLVHLSN